MRTSRPHGGTVATHVAAPARPHLGTFADLSCVVWGHVIDNRAFLERGRSCLRCGAPILREDGSRTHVGHTFSCFLRHHTYVEGGTRDGHHEYICVRCGHPLLFATESDPYARRDGFMKRVRYLCGLVGHRASRR
jgi:DNA-directed RNA polymerase subunit RPC12/RpoP